MSNKLSVRTRVPPLSSDDSEEDEDADSDANPKRKKRSSLSSTTTSRGSGKAKASTPPATGVAGGDMAAPDVVEDLGAWSDDEWS